MRAELLPVGDPRWPAFLESVRHDCYHLPAYVGLTAEHEGGEPFAVLVEDGDHALLQPLIVRPIPGGGRDATTPYGYPGPLVRGDPAFVGPGMTGLVDHLAGLEMVSLFVRLHPLLNEQDPGGLGTIRHEGPTVSIDLTRPEAEQWRQVRGNHRIHINRARRAGRVVRWDDTWDHEADFLRLYHATMGRVGASGWYFFDEEHVAALRAALGERLRLAVVEVDGTIAAAGMFITTGGIIQYHLSGSDERWAREGLTKLLIDHARRWGTERGAEVLHLGGGVGGAEDALLHFKSGFSERRHVFKTLRVVLNRRAYAELTTSDARAAGGDWLPDLEPSSYFPAYRAARTAAGRALSADDRLTVRPITPADASALGELLPRIDSTFFQPHPMTEAEAARIARHVGRDRYLLGYADGVPVAYGMLRGWDDGYPTPSLGVGVRHDLEGRGFGRAMMSALHLEARRAGATSVRLRVHPANRRARGLYASLGYRADGTDRGEDVMVLQLETAG